MAGSGIASDCTRLSNRHIGTHHLRSGLETMIKMLGRFRLGKKSARDGVFKLGSLS